MKNYTHLTPEERVLISDYHKEGISINHISRMIGRNKSSIAREIKRNCNETGYDPQTATHRYLTRQKRRSLMDIDHKLRNYVLDRLHEGLSPQQISLRLKNIGHTENICYICPETIYRWLYQPAQVSKQLYKLLKKQNDKRLREKEPIDASFNTIAQSIKEKNSTQ